MYHFRVQELIQLGHLDAYIIHITTSFCFLMLFFKKKNVRKKGNQQLTDIYAYISIYIYIASLILLLKY